jgi:hypothetical protein
LFTDDEVAVVAYEAGRGYDHVIGDPWVDPPWPGLPQWYRDTVISAVRAVRRRGLSARELHEYWRSQYRQLGWVHGEVKDEHASPPTHPCLVPYDQLPRKHQVKDALFRDTVLMVLRLDGCSA